MNAGAYGMDTIVAFLEKNGQQVQSMVGIATDGASVMVGKHHSVFTRLKEKQPSIQFIRCIYYSIDSCK